jgi:hypothetical protein
MGIGKKIGKKSAITIIVVAVLVAAGAVVFFKHNTKDVIPVSSSGSSSSGKAQSKSTKKTDSGGGDSTGSSAKTPPPATQSLKTPFGTFVSNHHPNLSGSPAPATEESVCNTTPGATCYIEFSKDGTVKQLPTETAGSSGSVYWSWNVKQAGLTAGTWTIKAVTGLDGKTMSAQDNLGLDVGP